MAGISDALERQFILTFAIGWLDACTGYLVDEEDFIDGETSLEIRAGALACIAGAEDIIAANYMENPQEVHDAIYQAGQLAYLEAERQAIQRN